MSTLNLGILAHVDAGKTSLTERLLFDAGIINEIGSVDDGSTQTDTLALERRRGITIKSAVVSFALGDVTVNLIDTPGHPDFIAEVERVLHVLDGAVLVVSAVEGVQAQTRILMRTLRRLRIPTLLFVNKIDRVGADPERVIRDIAGKLTPAVVPMGRVVAPGTREAAFLPYHGAGADEENDRSSGTDAAGRLAAGTYGGGDRGADAEEHAARLTELLAEHDDEVLAAYVEGRAIAYPRLRRCLAAQTGRALVHPVYSGSAITGTGAAELAAGIRKLLPASAGSQERRSSDVPSPGGGARTTEVNVAPAARSAAVGIGSNTGDGHAGTSGTVFKVERGKAGEKVAYVRMFSGDVRIREKVRFGSAADGRDHEAKVTAIRLFDRGDAVAATSVPAGRIGKLWGLHEVRIGDTIGDESGLPAERAGYFAPPTLETVVVPRHRSDKGRMHTALTQLAEQDPLIDLRQDDIRDEVFVSLYGEVQKEVIQETLATEYGLEVDFCETTTICVERPVGTGHAVEVMKEDDNPFLATVGLRIEPAPVGSGVTYRLDSQVHGTMPHAFYKAVEDTVRATLREGLHGWQVTDCTVSLTHTGYAPRQSHAHQGFDKSMSSTGADFRGLTPLVVMAALRDAGTVVCEPMHRFRLEAPADTLGEMLPVLGRLGAVPEAPELTGAVYVMEGEIPAGRVHELQRQLPGLTRGEGMLESEFERYVPVRGPAPERRRTDHNPLNRKEYLLQVTRRVEV